LELRRKIASLEKRLSGGAGAKEFKIESPVLLDTAAWAELNKGSNARLLRSFMMPSYLQIHAQPMPEARTGRVKHIRGGAVELIGGRGEFDSEDWARYLALNYPDYIISQRQSDGSYKRFTVVLPAQRPCGPTTRSSTTTSFRRRPGPWRRLTRTPRLSRWKRPRAAW
jgi:hypothetical protein